MVESSFGAKPLPANLVEDVAALIWRDTYRHDTLLNWTEIKRGMLHHKRVIAAAKAVVAHLQEHRL